MGEITVRQAILHGTIAAAFVEAVLRAWGIRRAGWRLAFWVLALAFPFLATPAFLVSAPSRSTDAFTAGLALFASQRWHSVRLAGLGIDDLVFGLLALAGTLLCLRDLVPFLVEGVRERRQTPPIAVTPPELVSLVERLAAQAGVPPPAITLLESADPVLFVRGLRDHVLVLSAGVLASLREGELRAAIAHELAHIRFRDPLAGWVLMTARLAMFWNPAVQLVCRAIAQEMEHRADRFAAQTAGVSRFTTALRTVAAVPADAAAPLDLFAERLHHAHISARLAAVSGEITPLGFARTRLALVGITLTVLLFFVV